MIIKHRLAVNPNDLLPNGKFLAFVDGGMMEVTPVDVLEASKYGVVVEGPRMLPERDAL